MEAIFDATGKPVAWLYQRQYVIDRSNVCRAFVRERLVFSADRRVLGEFADGYIWDARGEAVAFIRGAKNGPNLPAPHVCPPAPLPPALAVPPLSPVVASLPTHRIKWSRSTLESLLRSPAMPQRPDRRRTAKRFGASYRAPALEIEPQAVLAAASAE